MLISNINKLNKLNTPIQMINGEEIDNILLLWKEIEKGNRINYNQVINVDQAMELMKIIRNFSLRLEVQILIDDIMTSVIRGISVELAEELRGYIG